MPHAPHEIAAEFPEDGAILHQLKLNDAHFNVLAGRYHELNGQIYRIETEIEAASDDRLEMLKKQRLALIDEIALMVSAEKSAAG